MTTIERATVVGVFTDRAQAEQALADLRHAGFNDDEIGFAVRHTEYTEHMHVPDHPDSAKGAAAGAVGGGVLGGVIGAAIALLIPGFGPAIAGGVLGAVFGGAALGAATGGFMGAMTALGLSEEEAHYYQREFEIGRVIVTVKAPGRAQEAHDLLLHAGAYDSSTQTNDGTPGPSADLYTPSVSTETAPTSYVAGSPLLENSYSQEAPLDPLEEDPTERMSALSRSASSEKHMVDSVAHYEGAADRANRNNIPSGTGN